MTAAFKQMIEQTRVSCQKSVDDWVATCRAEGHELQKSGSDNGGHASESIIELQKSIDKLQHSQTEGMTDLRKSCSYQEDKLRRIKRSQEDQADGHAKQIWKELQPLQAIMQSVDARCATTHTALREIQAQSADLAKLQKRLEARQGDMPLPEEVRTTLRMPRQATQYPDVQHQLLASQQQSIEHQNHMEPLSDLQQEQQQNMVIGSADADEPMSPSGLDAPLAVSLIPGQSRELGITRADLEQLIARGFSSLQAEHDKIHKGMRAQQAKTLDLSQRIGKFEHLLLARDHAMSPEVRLGVDQQASASKAAESIQLPQFIKQQHLDQTSQQRAAVSLARHSSLHQAATEQRQQGEQEAACIVPAASDAQDQQEGPAGQRDPEPEQQRSRDETAGAAQEMVLSNEAGHQHGHDNALSSIQGQLQNIGAQLGIPNGRAQSSASWSAALQEMPRAAGLLIRGLDRVLGHLEHLQVLNFAFIPSMLKILCHERARS